MAEKRIYRIGDALVRAKTSSQAVVHVARKLRQGLKAKLASQDDMAELIGKGVKIEEAGDDTTLFDAPLEVG